MKNQLKGDVIFLDNSIDEEALYNILANIEDCLHIDITTRGHNDLIKNAMEGTLIELDMPLNEKPENGKGKDLVDNFYSRIITYMKGFSLYCMECLWNGYFPINLREVNYLGAEPKSLRSGLLALQRKEHQVNADAFLESVIDASKDIEMCMEKRLLLIMIVTYKLEIYNVCSIFAAYLFWGITQKG